MHDFALIDSHLHCGRQNVSWLWEDLPQLLLPAGIRGATLIEPVVLRRLYPQPGQEIGLE